MNLLKYEEAQLNAWPAINTAFLQGWVLRFAEGYTRRANSVTPMYYSEPTGDFGLGDYDELIHRIESCEALYEARDLASCFRIRDDGSCGDLDAALASRGYLIEAPTQVMRLDLGATREAPIDPRSSKVESSSELPPGWVDSVCAMNGHPEAKTKLTKILEAIVPERRFFTLRDSGQATALGYFAMEAGLAGIYDIIVEPSLRRKGYGRILVSSMLREAKALGAVEAYLQVMDSNPAAINLYRELGFERIYGYHYRKRTL